MGLDAPELVNGDGSPIAAHAEHRIIHDVQARRQIRKGLMRQTGSSDNVALAAGVRKGARVGRRHGTDQVVDLLGRFGPVDPAVFGFAAAEIAAVGQHVRVPRNVPGNHRGKRTPQGLLGRHRGLLEHFVRGVVRQDRHDGLVDDVTGIGLFDHLVQGGAGLGLAVQNRPVDGHAATVLGQQRTVHVERAEFGKAQQAHRDHVPVIE